MMGRHQEFRRNSRLDRIGKELAKCPPFQRFPRSVPWLSDFVHGNDLQPTTIRSWAEKEQRILNDRPRELSTGRIRGRSWLVAVGIAAGTIGVSTAFALDVPLPKTSSLQAGAAPQGSTNATASVKTGQTSTTATTSGPRVDWNATLGSRELRMGMAGSDVKQLQSVLRRKGQRVSVDGEFGRQTRGAVIRVQQRLKMKRTGIVNQALVRRLGVIIRAPRSVAPAPALAVAPTGEYPLAGPNAAAARYLKVFPVAGKHTYTNDFGAPRGQGPHQGNDIMADRIPVRAVIDGTITRANRVEKGLGGIYVWLKDGAGHEYYYAHLTSINPGIEPGVRVTAGQALGIVGNTGDARYGATHLHFEIRPSGSSPINPYNDLLAVDPEPPTRK